MGLPGGSDGKEFTCNARDQGLIPESERFSGEGRRIFSVIYALLND